MAGVKNQQSVLSSYNVFNNILWSVTPGGLHPPDLSNFLSKIITPIIFYPPIYIFSEWCHKTVLIFNLCEILATLNFSQSEEKIEKVVYIFWMN